ncbi:MAG TPA: PilZ domain-containing protein [Sphingomicrobium sp.]
MAKQRVETTVYSLSPAPPRRPERRKGERYFSLLRVGALIVDGRRELCLIRNVSAGGMMIRPYSPIAEGATVSVELKHGVTVSGEAQWADNGLVGVSFDEEIDVVALLTQSEDGPQPRMPRIALDCFISVRKDADVYRSRGINISQGGMCVRLDAALEIGAHLIVSTPGLPPTAGVVRWQDGEFYGIGFNRVFPVDELMNFLQSLQPQRRRVAG